MTALLAYLPSMGGAAAGTAAATSAGTMGLGAVASGLSAIGASASTASTLTSIGASSAAAMTGASSLSTLMSTALPLASAAFSLFGGIRQSQGIADQAKANARALELQSDEEILAAKQEELRGKQDANDILDNLNKTLATNRLIAGASGIDPLAGTKSQVQTNTAKSANLALSTSRQDAKLRSLSRRRQASEMLVQRGITLQRGSSDATTAAFSGLASAGNTAADYYYRGVNRG